MSCILRAYGDNFDVKSFIAMNVLTIDSLWVKGEMRFPGSKVIQTVNASSGVRIVASDAEFTELPKQIEDTVAFLREHHGAIGKLTSYPGVEAAVLDFCVNIYPPGWASFAFPPELLSLTGSVGISLCLSVYPTEGELDADG
jgi:hypothetical protein